MIQVLYDKLAVPDTCHLGKRVFKKLFHENAKLGVTDKKALRDDIDTITWVYTLKPSTIPIRAYEDDRREYLEVAILQVDLKKQKRTRRIAEVMHRAIPYPLLIVYAIETLCALSVGHKRFSQAEKGAIVADDILVTDWIDTSTPSLVQREFLDSLEVTTLPHTHFYAFYSALVERLIALDCAGLTGEFHVATARRAIEARRSGLAACHELEAQIAEKKAEMKLEAQFNRQVELNLEIKRLEADLTSKVKSL